MAISAADLFAWLHPIAEKDPEALLAIDEGGLSLQIVDGLNCGAYIEIGGTPEEWGDDEKR